MPYYHDVLFPGTLCDLLAATRWRTREGRSECVGRGRCWSLNVAAFGNVRSQFRNRISIETGSPWQRHQRWRSAGREGRSDHRTPRISISRLGYNSKEHQIRVLPTRPTTWHSKCQCSLCMCKSALILKFKWSSGGQSLRRAALACRRSPQSVRIKRSITCIHSLVLSR